MDKQALSKQVLAPWAPAAWEIELHTTFFPASVQSGAR